MVTKNSTTKAQEKLKDECDKLMKYSATIEDALVEYGINNNTIVEGLIRDIGRLEHDFRNDIKSISELRKYREMLIRLIGGFAPERRITANIEYKWVEGDSEKK